MTTKSTTLAEPESSTTGYLGYVSRNRRWISPLMFAAYAWIVPWLLATPGAALSDPLPSWAWHLQQIVGCFGSGLGAKFTDTLSADVVGVLGLLLGIAAVASAVL